MNSLRQTLLALCWLLTTALTAQTADEFFFQGQQAYDLGQLNEAETYFSRAVDLSPGHLRAYFNRGLVRLEAGQPAAARQDFEFMVRAEPSDSESWMLLGDCLVELQETGAAFEVYGYSIKLYPTAAAYVARGNLHLSQRDFNAADFDFRSATQLEPENPGALAGVGATCLATNRADEAISYFDRALRYRAGDASVWYNRAQANIDLQQYRAAAVDLERALELDQTNSDSYALLALCELKREEVETATVYARRARRLNKENGLSWYVLAEVSRAQNDYDWAFNHYDMALIAEPDNATFYYERGELAYNAGFLEAARMDWSRALHLEPNNQTVADRLQQVEFVLAEEEFQLSKARTRFESASEVEGRTEDEIGEEMMSSTASFQVNIFEH